MATNPEDHEHYKQLEIARQADGRAKHLAERINGPGGLYAFNHLKSKAVLRMVREEFPDYEKLQDAVERGSEQYGNQTRRVNLLVEQNARLRAIVGEILGHFPDRGVIEQMLADDPKIERPMVLQTNPRDRQLLRWHAGIEVGEENAKC